jgi:hypothetical protein
MLIDLADKVSGYDTPVKAIRTREPEPFAVVE